MSRESMSELFSATNKVELKGIVKEAIKEWLNEKAAEFGRWSFRWLLFAMLGVVLYFWLAAHGWRPPQ